MALQPLSTLYYVCRLPGLILLLQLWGGCFNVTSRVGIPFPKPPSPSLHSSPSYWQKMYCFFQIKVASMFAESSIESLYEFGHIFFNDFLDLAFPPFYSFVHWPFSNRWIWLYSTKDFPFQFRKFVIYLWPKFKQYLLTELGFNFIVETTKISASAVMKPW